MKEKEILARIGPTFESCYECLQQNDGYSEIQHSDDCSRNPKNIKKPIRICLDLDGTICENKKDDQLYRHVKPLPGAVEAIKKLREQGHHITIHTARGMATYGGNVSEVIAHRAGEVIGWLRLWDISYDALLFGKPDYDIQIDDNTHKHVDWESSMKAIEERIKLGPRVKHRKP